MARRAPRNMEKFKKKMKINDNKINDNNLNTEKSITQQIKDHNIRNLFNTLHIVAIALGLFLLAYGASYFNWCDLKFALEVAGAPFILAVVIYELEGISKDSRDFYEAISKQNKDNS